MRMAEYARAPVLIVGDIDRGGVFASFVGTMEVLSPWERRLVVGWIVNRFRGDPSLLEPALDYTNKHTGRPVLGVVPFLPDLHLPQEDSAGLPLEERQTASGKRQAAIQIAVLALPHIANFTDFDPFAVEPDVEVHFVRSARELNGPDAVIIPGSKNTQADLAYLRSSGLAERLEDMARTTATEIVGVCGGLQMLGQAVGDPQGIESTNGHSPGLGLLGVSTVMAAAKTLRRTRAVHTLSGLEVTGYEIHHGQTAFDGTCPLFTGADGQVVGAASADQRIWGTYLHGVFDDPQAQAALLRWAGLRDAEAIDVHALREASIERLADAVDAHLPWPDLQSLRRGGDLLVRTEFVEVVVGRRHAFFGQGAVQGEARIARHGIASG